METAAALLRRARKHAGLSQDELGQRTGLGQSVISAYESGRREPSFAQVGRIVTASGAELTLSLDDSSSLERVRAHRDELIDTLGSLGARNIRVFGSVARGDDRFDSDIDLLVDIDETVGLVELGKMETAAERILGRPADVVPVSSLKPDIRISALEDATPL